MLTRKTTALLLVLLSFFSNAATFEEIKRIDALQTEGKTIICTSTNKINIDGVTKPLIINTKITGYVKYNNGKEIIYSVTHQQRNENANTDFSIMSFELKSSLEENRQRFEIKESSIKVTAYSTAYTETLKNFLKENIIYYVPFDRIKVTNFPSYEQLPEVPNGAITYCDLM